MRRAAFRFVAAIAVSLGCAGDSEPDAPGVLLISVDTLRRDHVSAYGYDRPTTPVIDRLAREGALFERALSTSNWTLPAHASMLTGLSPSSHQVEDARDRLPDQVGTLAEALLRAGYRTGGFASHVYLDERYGFARGFEDYRVVPDQPAEEVTRQALAWLKKHPREPFFLFLHYFDPHWDFAPPPPFDRRFGAARRELGRLDHLFRYFSPETPMPPDIREDVIRLYDGEIAYTDAQIGELLEELRASGRLDSTVVAVTSDHGEEFGEHGTFGHGTHLHAEVVLVPLAIRFPARIAAGTRRSDPAWIADLPATLLGLSGADVAPRFLAEGRALFSSTQADDAAPARTLVAESSRHGPKRLAIEGSGRKLLGWAHYRSRMFSDETGQLEPVWGAPVSRRPALYDVGNDPGEAIDRIDSKTLHSDLVSLDAALRDWVAQRARGLQLLCTARAGGDLSGHVTFDAPLPDEPFVPGALDRVELRRVEPARYWIHLQPGEAGSGLLFPLGPEARSVTIALAEPGQREFGERFSLPLADGPSRLRMPGAPNHACGVSTGTAPPARSKGTLELSPTDLETLRKLGYLE